MNESNARNCAELSGRQRVAILAILATPTIEAAAKQARVNPATLRRWSYQPAFSKALDSARNETFASAIARLHSVAGAAVERLERGLRSKDSRLAMGAARTLLAFAMEAHSSMDLERRIAELESKIKRDQISPKYENQYKSP